MPPSSPTESLETTAPLPPARTSLDGESGLPRWFSLIFRITSHIEMGNIDFVLPDGRRFRAAGSQPGQTGELIVHDPRLFGRMVRDGELGIAEAYMEGWWSSPDLQVFLDVCLLNNEQVGRALPFAKTLNFLNRIRHWLNKNTKTQAKKNIEAHYDLGNDFYRLWLDPSMTYSSALYERPDMSLEDAQRAKYRSICDRMALRQGDSVLEIGCGWGGFAEYAAKERGAKVTGLTLSPAQLDYAQARMQREGLNERVELVLRDYRDERGSYDGVASIEMFEAVGEQYWPSYFDTLRARLKPGGIASLQIITIADELFDGYRRKVDFIQKYIFPGGMLPSQAALREQADRFGLHWEGSLRFGESYSQTLRHWFRDFNAAWPQIQELGFDMRFQRMWNFYLTVCAACFHAGTTDVEQVALRKTA
ncbi:MAG: cyclopropane-fatty-acyl-phospholipid synthase family protein [Neomegalonema sp.]|nr:cyclopropane-fatty-acyl-phospholipid synthase family protein [Neomegalonema sp.]